MRVPIRGAYCAWVYSERNGGKFYSLDESRGWLYIVSLSLVTSAYVWLFIIVIPAFICEPVMIIMKLQWILYKYNSLRSGIYFSIFHLIKNTKGIIIQTDYFNKYWYIIYLYKFNYIFNKRIKAVVVRKNRSLEKKYFYMIFRIKAMLLILFHGRKRLLFIKKILNLRQIIILIIFL